MNRTRVVGAMLVAAVLATGGCAGSSDNTGSDTADTPSGTADRAPTTTTSPAPAASTVAGLLALGRPIVLAHAAGENAHPHSTPYGYADSVKAGVDVLDFDVQLSKDGVLVVQHDATVDRTTNGTGNVADMTYAELAKLDNAYWFTDECTCKDQPEKSYELRGVRTGDVPPPKGYAPDDFIIPRFEDIAAKYPKFVLNIEIKGKAPDAVPAAKELARIITEQGREQSTVVTAFDDTLAEAFHETAPTVAITPGLAATTAYVLSNQLPADGRTILQVPPDYEGTTVLTPELVARTKEDGLVLWIWPNERKWENAEGYGKLLDMGVDGLNAADPAVAVAAVAAQGKRTR